MMTRFERCQPLLGDGMNRLKESHVVVVGIGGVGSYAVEALARSGVGKITVVDDDLIAESNINRQLFALSSTVGKRKVDIALRRISDINPDCDVIARFERVTADNAYEIIQNADYVIDAIDCVSAKVALVEAALSKNIRIVSCMGTGNKLDPSALKLADLSKTTTCPLARAVRVALRKRGILHVPVLFSTEQPVANGNPVPSSVAFVPSVAGLLLAGKVIRDLAQNKSVTAE